MKNPIPEVVAGSGEVSCGEWLSVVVCYQVNLAVNEHVLIYQSTALLNNTK